MRVTTVTATVLLCLVPLAVAYEAIDPCEERPSLCKLSLDDLLTSQQAGLSKPKRDYDFVRFGKRSGGAAKPPFDKKSYDYIRFGKRAGLPYYPLELMQQ